MKQSRTCLARVAGWPEAGAAPGASPNVSVPKKAIHMLSERRVLARKVGVALLFDSFDPLIIVCAFATRELWVAVIIVVVAFSNHLKKEEPLVKSTRVS